IHVMDGENASRLIQVLDRREQLHATVIVINCMPDLMRRTRMGRLDLSRLTGIRGTGKQRNGERNPLALLAAAGSWMGRQVKRGKGEQRQRHGHGQYL